MSTRKILIKLGGLLPAMCIGGIGLTAVAAASLPPPVASEAVALIYPPWYGAEESFRETINSGGRVVKPGTVDFVVLAVGDDPAFFDRARNNGAWLVVGADGPFVCGTTVLDGDPAETPKRNRVVGED